MKLRFLVLAVAVATVAGFGSVSAADEFETLAGIPAEAMTTPELQVVVGAFRMEVITPHSNAAISFHLIIPDWADGEAALMARNTTGYTGKSPDVIRYAD